MNMQHIYNQSQFGENWFNYQFLYQRMVGESDSGSIFVEVGSWKGKSTAFMCVEIANSEKLIDFHCVDTWNGSPEHVRDGHNLKELYDTFTTNMQSLKNYYTPHRMTSVEGSNLFKNESLDFVFIDACHEYECVIEDIKHWLPKVKPGGVLAGHDADWPGVKRAVEECLGNVNVEETSWIYRK